MSNVPLRSSCLQRNWRFADVTSALCLTTDSCKIYTNLLEGGITLTHMFKICTKTTVFLCNLSNYEHSTFRRYMMWLIISAVYTRIRYKTGSLQTWFTDFLSPLPIITIFFFCKRKFRFNCHFSNIKIN